MEKGSVEMNSKSEMSKGRPLRQGMGFSLLAILLPVLLGFVLSGCAKKDENFKRETETALGASPRDSETQDASQVAQSQSFSLDIVQVDAPVSSPQGLKVRSVVKINNEVRDLNTNHFSPAAGNSAYSSGYAQMAGYQVDVIAKCGDSTCKQYYLLLSIYTMSNEKHFQLGLKYDYAGLYKHSYTLREPHRWIQNFEDFVRYMNDASNFL